MRRIIASVVSGLLMVTAFPGMANARDDANKQRWEYEKYAAMYPGATRRQLRNARAYDRGEYYEIDSNAHPVGSPSWWSVREREGRDRRR